MLSRVIRGSVACVVSVRALDEFRLADGLEYEVMTLEDRGGERQGHRSMQAQWRHIYWQGRAGVFEA